MSARYNLRSNSPSDSNTDTNNPADEVLTEGTSASSSSTSSTGRRPVLPSPYFRGFAVGPIFIPVHTSSSQRPNMAENEAADGNARRDGEDNLITSSQDRLHNINEGVDEFQYQDAQDAQDFNMNLDEDYSDALQKIDNQFKRNKVSSFLSLIKDDLGALNGAMLDQVQPTLLEEDMQDILGKVAVYASLVGTLVDIPATVDASNEVKDFIDAQKSEFTNLKKEVKEAKSKVQRILSGEAKMKAALAQAHKTSSSASSSSFLKLPRLQIPQFQDNQTGTINWVNFHSILLRLTAGMNTEEKIFLLKSALTGKSKRLVVNEQNFDAAIRMLQSCFGNELIETQSKIQEFVGMVTEEPQEKGSSELNRDLWQRFKMFSNYLNQLLDANGHEEVLDTIISALVLQRLPFHMKQLVIRSRREKEAASGNNLTLEELLDLYNNLIHDVEIASTSREAKKRTEKPDVDDKKGAKSVNKRGASRSLLTKTKPSSFNKKKGKCVLCGSAEHNVRSHHMDKHGTYSLDDIKKALAENNRCQKCAGVMEEDGNCAKGDCRNVIRPCYHCSSLAHHNLLCPNPKMGPSAFGPSANDEF